MVHAPRNDTEDVIGRAARAHDRLLVVFHECAVDLKLGDELAAYAGEKAIAGQS